MVGILLQFVCAASLFGDFVDGVESFDGTVIDTETWELFQPDRFSQNNVLMIDQLSFVTHAEAATRFVTVGIGDTVRAEVTLDDYPTLGGSVLGAATLVFATNSTGNSGAYRQDDFFVEVGIEQSTIGDTGQLSANWKNDSSIQGFDFHRFGESILGQTVWLELERLDQSSFRFAGYNDENLLIAEYFRSGLFLPTNTPIILATNGSARFDNVTVS